MQNKQNLLVLHTYIIQQPWDCCLTKDLGWLATHYFKVYYEGLCPKPAHKCFVSSDQRTPSWCLQESYAAPLVWLALV